MSDKFKAVRSFYFRDIMAHSPAGYYGCELKLWQCRQIWQRADAAAKIWMKTTVDEKGRRFQ